MNEDADTGGTMTRDADLAQRFVSMADTLVDDYDVMELLDQLVRSCVELLDVTTSGLLLVTRQGRLQPVASSTETTRLLELFQLQSDEGPCLDCVRSGEPVIVPDIEELRERWPRFSAQAMSSGFRSVYALPMRLRKETLGSLNLFHTRRRPLDDSDQRIAQALADVATIGILQQRSRHRASLLAEQLQSALDTRVVIEQAKGVLAEYGGVGMDVAFDALRSYARGHHVKLGVAAEGLVRRRIDASAFLTPRRR